jgi:hypothetical protein
VQGRQQVCKVNAAPKRFQSDEQWKGASRFVRSMRLLQGFRVKSSAGHQQVCKVNAAPRRLQIEEQRKGASRFVRSTRLLEGFRVKSSARASRGL